MYSTDRLSGTFAPYLRRWALTPDGEMIVTRSSRLLPVRLGGQPAMLKLAIAEEEKGGGALMAWWDGHGAARVLAKGDDAVVLERATGSRSLIAMAQSGEDEQASIAICDVAGLLHRARPGATPRVVPLATWFRRLHEIAPNHCGVIALAASMADTLLANPRDQGVLHGDIHHANILDFGDRGWLAIDPKGLWGERGFDYANLFRNPDSAVALRHGRFDQQVQIVSSRAGLEPVRLLQWILAVMGLSAAWHIDDIEKPGTTLAVGRMAAAALRL
jgi:streptomycin 6-kinase